MVELTPELANKVLTADLRNVVQKVGDGGILSGAERDIIAGDHIVTATAEEIQKARVAALLLKWTKGARLSPEERAEIGLQIPSDRTAARALTSDTYQHPQLHYAKVYDVTTRAVKAWIKEGRELKTPDLPPLDEPEKMAAWYQRVKQRRVPAQLVALAVSKKDQVSGSTQSTTAPAHTQPSSSLGMPRIEELTHGADFGYDKAVQFAAENLDYAQQQLRLARRPGEDGNIDAVRLRDCETAANKALEQYRKAKADEHDQLQRQGGMVDRRRMVEMVRTRLGATHQAVRSCPVRVGTKLALPPELVRQLVALWNQEIDSIFTQLSQDRWQYKEALHLQS